VCPVSSSFCVKKKAINFQIEALQVLFEDFTLKKQETIEA
jgi:hypothetical protein